MTMYTYTDANGEEKQININLGDIAYDKLINGEWNLGFIQDNPGIDQEINSNFYHKEKINIGNTQEENCCFNNKITVKLCDGSIKTGHMIHWVPNILEKGLFCISNDRFWDTFNDTRSTP